MARMDVGGAIAPAFQHMVRVLFRPWELRKWFALGFVSLIAYGGGSSFQTPDFSNWKTSDDSRREFLGSSPISEIIQYWPLIALGVVILIGIWLLLMWLSSVLHFVYVDEVTRSSGAIREPFARLKGRGTSYLLWHLAFGAILMLALGLLVALPLILVFALAPEAGTGAKVAAVVWAVIIGIPLIIIAIVIEIFATDFVTPVMYVRGVGIIEGWRVVRPILRANVGQAALYLLLLIGLGIVMAIFGIVVALLLALVLLIPVGLLVLPGYLIWQAGGLGWTPPVIGIAIGLGVIIFLGFIYLLQCAVQPALVFRRAYSLVVLGQADPSLVTVPTGTPPPAGAEQS